MKFLLLIIAAFSFVFSVVANAQIYKWVDENGKVHYSQFKPQDKSKKASTVKLNIIGELPSIDIKSPIKYEKVWPSAGISIEELKLDIAGANSRDVKIGNQLSGPGCTKNRRDIMWVNGNGYLRGIDSTQVITDVFKVAGYNVTTGNLSSYGVPTSRLSLNVELNKVLINRCQDQKFGSGSKNDVYIKVHWVLFDRLAKATLFEGDSEGIYKGMKKLARSRGTSQAIERAFTIAARNILAEFSFVQHLENPDPLDHFKDHYADITLDIKYSSGQQTFKSIVPQLKQSSLTVRTINGHGSGVLIAEDGYVLTNAHVVGDAKQVIVVVNDEDMEARVVRSDSIRDVALLQISKNIAATPAKLADNKPGIGDNLYVIGTPLSESLMHTVTGGIFSAERLIKGYKYYQTDATINPGNSGGPVFNDKGGLVAISVAGLFSKAGAGLGVNYVIPIEDALTTLKIKKGSRTAALSASSKIAKDTTVKLPPPKPKNTDKEKVYKLYEKALDAKQKLEFDKAKSILKEAIKHIADGDDSDDSNQVRDELYIFLPITIARDAIEKHKPDIARKAIKPVRRYIKKHPKRFEISKQLDEIEEVIRYLERALEANVKQEFTVVKIFLKEYYQTNGELPASVRELNNLIYNNMGPKISDKYLLKSYTPASNGYVIVFQDVHTKKEITIKDKFGF